MWSKMTYESPMLCDKPGQALELARVEEPETLAEQTDDDDVDVVEEEDDIQHETNSIAEHTLFANQVNKKREARKKLRKQYKKEAIRQLQDPNDPSWFTRFRTTGEVILKADYITAVPVISDHALAGNDSVLCEVRQSYSLAFRKGCASPNAIMDSNDNVILVLNASGRDQVLKNRDVVAKGVRANSDIVTFTVNGEDLSDIRIASVAAEQEPMKPEQLTDDCKKVLYANWTRIRATSDDTLPMKFDLEDKTCKEYFDNYIANRASSTTTSSRTKLDESMILMNQELSDKDKKSLTSLVLKNADVFATSLADLVQLKKKDLVLLDMGNKPIGLLKGLDYFNTGPYEIVEVMADRPNTFKIKLPGKRKHPWVSGEHLRLYTERNESLIPPQISRQTSSHETQLSETQLPETLLPLTSDIDIETVSTPSPRRSKRQRRAPERLNL
ncbi:hypothetical protein HDE_12159 [Halotydeus destructor]|nr:hypothetical protein HDE_12159 [Halotydeus destructor]